ncbi:MAG: uracil-DNA glycosylase [Planctomycetota bacterium JB042]
MTDPTAVRRSLLAWLETDLGFGLEEIRRLDPIRPATSAEPAPRAATPPPPAAAPPSPRTPPAPAPAARTPSPPAAPARASAFRPRVAPLAERLGSPEKRAALDALDAEVAGCTLCKLSRGRTLAVPGEGNVDADLMFVGEGPGADEDRSGRPFVGRAGELLTKIVEAMGFSRETVFIANIVKCRPPGNRDPEPDETASCFPFLERQLEIVEPKVICTLGLPATRKLLDIRGGISAVRGRKFAFRGIPLIPTFHPAYLLRNPAGKKQVWSDVQTVARLVEERGGVVPFRDRLARNTGGAAGGA